VLEVDAWTELVGDAGSGLPSMRIGKPVVQVASMLTTVKPWNRTGKPIFMTILANFRAASLSSASVGVPITTILPESKRRATDLGFTRRMMAPGRPLGLYSVFLVLQVMRSRSRWHPSLHTADMFCGKRVY